MNRLTIKNRNHAIIRNSGPYSPTGAPGELPMAWTQIGPVWPDVCENGVLKELRSHLIIIIKSTEKIWLDSSKNLA